MRRLLAVTLFCGLCALSSWAWALDWWGTPQYAGTTGLTKVVFANLPACQSGIKGRAYVVTDCISPKDCTDGGGAGVEVVVCDGSNWLVQRDGGSGSGSASGSTGWMQYNAGAGVFGAEGDFHYNSSTNTLTVGTLSGNVSGSVLGTSSGTTLRSNGTAYVPTPYALPSGDGTSGQLLQTNGSGTISWASIAGNVATDGIWAAAGDLLVGTGNDQGAVLSRSATGKFLQDTGSPAWSGYKLPTTVGAAGTMWRSNATDMIAITPAANAVLVTNGSNVPSLSGDLPTSTTIGGSDIYRVGGTPIAAADGGTGIQDVSTDGNVLKSTGTAWESADYLDVAGIDVGDVTLQIPNGTSGTTDTTGEIYLDTNGDTTNITAPMIQISHNNASISYVPTFPIPLAASQNGYALKYDSSAKSLYWGVDATSEGYTQLGDVVATSPVHVNGSTNVNDILPGIDQDVTFSVDLKEKIWAVFDGGGSPIEANKKVYVYVPYDCTINDWTILADQAGSISVDVWKVAYSDYPPNVASSIAMSSLITLSSQIKNQDLDVTNWFLNPQTISAGDVLCFNVTGAATAVTWVSVALTVTRN